MIRKLLFRLFYSDSIQTGMERKKNTHLYTGRPIPRRTAYRKRKRLENQPNNSTSSSDDEATTSARSNVRFRPVPSEQPNQANVQVAADATCAVPNDQFPNSNTGDSSSNNEGCSDDNANPFVSHYDAFPDDSSQASWSSNNDISDGNESTTSGVNENAEDSNEDEEPNGDREDVHFARVQYQMGGQPLLNDILHPGLTTTEGDVLVMVLALAARHNWSWCSVVDLLRMINVMFGNEVVKDSKYFLMKFMDIAKDEVTIHCYCDSCEAYVGTKTLIETGDVQQCPSCENPINDQKSSFFITVDVQGQIIRLLKNPQVATEIKTYRFQRAKVSEDCIEDVYDGRAYQNLVEEGILSDPNNFSYTFNTDGVNVTKSSSKSVWPIFLQINELSPQNRKKFMILAGLWVGDKDPNMQLFLNSFVEQANRLSTEGVHWENELGENQLSKIIPTSLIADSGARYKILNMSSYTAYYGCTFCYQVAVHTEKGRRFPVAQSEVHLRTHDSTLHDMREAFNNRDHPDKKKRVYKGTKGPCALISMNYFSFSNGVVVDFMHSVLLGNVRSHFSYLLEHSKNKYYIGSPNSLFVINNILTSLQTPSVITRSARKLSECKNWKANEWRCMLLFYAIPCLKGVLPPEYISHLALLSTAVFLLLQKTCSQNDIQVAEEYLLKYAFLTQEYFGITAMLYNVHLLQHIIKGVLDWGPLWTHNTFSFEGQNCSIVQMYSSPFQVGLQICRRYLMFNAMPSLCEKYAASESSIDFVESLTGKKLKFFHRVQDVVLSGKGHPYQLCVEETNALTRLNLPNVNRVMAYKKLFKRGFRLSTQAYSVGKKRADCYVTTKTGSKGIIKNILLCSYDNNESDVLLCVRKLRLESRGALYNSTVKVRHIKKVTGEGAMCLLYPKDIEYPCVFIEVDDEKFIADIPFGARGD